MFLPAMFPLNREKLKIAIIFKTSEPKHSVIKISAAEGDSSVYRVILHSSTWSFVRSSVKLTCSLLCGQFLAQWNVDWHTAHLDLLPYLSSGFVPGNGILCWYFCSHDLPLYRHCSVIYSVSWLIPMPAAPAGFPPNILFSANFIDAKIATSFFQLSYGFASPAPGSTL